MTDFKPVDIHAGFGKAVKSEFKPIPVESLKTQDFKPIGLKPIKSKSPAPVYKVDFTPDIMEKAKPFMAEFEAAEKAYGLPKGLLINLAFKESTFNPEAVSPRGATGLMQIMPNIHKDVDPKDPKASIHYSAKYLKKLYDRFGSWEKALAAYNWGEGNLSKYGMEKLPPETSKYVEFFKSKMADLDLKPVEVDKPLAFTKVPAKEAETAPLETPAPEDRIKELSWRQGSDEPSLFGRFIRSITGELPERKLSPEARAMATVELGAMEEGIPLSEYREAPDIVEQAAQSLVGMGTFGIVPMLAEQLKSEEPVRSTSKPGYAGEALGSIGGFILGPISVAKSVLKPVLAYLPQATAEQAVAARVIKTALSDAVTLGGGMGAASLGNVLEQTSFADAADVVATNIASGAATGALFGVAKGLFPHDPQRFVRILTGLTALNAQRVIEHGPDAYTKRPISEVMFDTAMDIVFLWSGLPESKFKRVERTIQEILTQRVRTDLMPERPLAKLKEAEQELERLRLEAAEALIAKGDVKDAQKKTKVAEPDTPFKNLTQGQDIVEGNKTGVGLRYEGLDEKGRHKITVTDGELKGKSFAVEGEITEEGITEAYAKRLKIIKKAKRAAALAAKKKAAGKKPAKKVSNVKLGPGATGKFKKFGEYGIELADLLGISGSNITIDFAAMPKRTIGEVTTKRDPKTGKVEHHITINTQRRKARQISNIAHELGHVFKAEIFDKLPKADQAKVVDSFKEWVESWQGETLYEALLDRLNLYSYFSAARKAPVTSQTLRVGRKVPRGGVDTSRFAEYQIRFDEWFAENTARWVATNKVPQTATEKYFHAFARGMHKVYESLIGQEFYPNQSFNEFMRDYFQKTRPELGVKIDKWFPPEGVKRTKADKDSDAVSEPRLPAEKSPFYQSEDKALAYAKVYRDPDRARHMNTSNPEVYLSKIINDLNLWHHRKIDSSEAEAAKEGLRELAVTNHGDYFQSMKEAMEFAELVSNASEWAAKLQRKGEEVVGEVKRKPKAVVKRRKKSDKNLTKEALEVIKNEESVNTVFYELAPEAEENRIIKSWNDNHDSLIKGIIKLLHRGKVDLDVNYSTGKMWDNIPDDMKPNIKMDKFPQTPDTIEADVSKKIPLESKSINSIFSDPPYLVVHGKHIPKMGKRFGYFKSLDELLAYHDGSMKEFARVLKPGGRLTIKVQDISHPTGERASTIAKAGYDKARTYDIPVTDYVKRFANKYGLRYLGKTIYVNKRGLLTSKGVQRIPRKAHVEFLTFEKTTRQPLGESKLLDKYGIGIKSKIQEKVFEERAPEAEFEVDKAISQLAGEFRNYTEFSRKSKRPKVRKLIADTVANFRRNWIDKFSNLRSELVREWNEEGLGLIRKAVLSKGANAIAAKHFKQLRKEVFKGFDRETRADLHDLILARRMIQISKTKKGKKFKYPSIKTGPKTKGAIDPIRAKALIIDLQNKYGDNYKVLQEASNTYFKWMKKALKDLRDAQLISAEDYERMKDLDYERLMRTETMKGRHEKELGKKTIKPKDRGVESLAHGRTSDILETDAEVLALDVFSRTYHRIATNRANLALYDFALKHPDNGFVMIAGTKGEKGKVLKRPRNWDKISVYVEGKKKSMYINELMSAEWILAEPELTSKWANFVRTWSGSNLLRLFATGVNPGFALANLPRDIMHAHWAAQMYIDGKWKGVYNPTQVIGLSQMAVDLVKVLPDAMLKKGRWLDFIESGGGFEFLSHQGRVTHRLRKQKAPSRMLEKLGSTLGWLGETSEALTRLAIMERVIKRRAKELGISVEEARTRKEIMEDAVFTARDYFDFAQGGGFAKAADTALPYFNASIQATRGVWRSMQQNPREAAWKLAQLCMIYTGMKAMNEAIAPQTTASIPEEISDTNFVIALSDELGFEDPDGQWRGVYITIPLDPSQTFFKVVFESGMDILQDKPVDALKVISKLKNFSPVDSPQGIMPPMINAITAYFYNKDTWLNEDVWKGKTLEWPKSKAEFEGLTSEQRRQFGIAPQPGDTPQAMIDLGQATGFSPERFKRALEQFVTSNNIYGSIASSVYNKLFADIPQDDRQRPLLMALADNPITGRFIRITSPYVRHRESIKKASQEDLYNTVGRNATIEALSDGYNKGIVTRDEVMGWIKTIKDQGEQDRLVDKFIYEKVIYKMPEKSFWRKLSRLSPDARAEAFYDRWSKATSDEKQQMKEEMKIISAAGGVLSDEFYYKLGIILKERTGKAGLE